MKALLRISKKSAKKVFQNLRENGNFFSPYLKENIQITKLFLNHIAFNVEKHRSIKEMMERLLIVPFLSEIVTSGEFQSKRGEHQKEFFEFSKSFGKDEFVVIIMKDSKGYFLLSCFRRK